MSHGLTIIRMAIAATVLNSPGLTTAEVAGPDVVLVHIDDLGWTGFGCYVANG
jgi:hypothetical protein